MVGYLTFLFVGGGGGGGELVFCFSSGVLKYLLRKHLYFRVR